MTREDIIRMARTAGLQRIYGACANAVGESSYEDWDYEIERFAELVAEAEREACVNACNDIHVFGMHQELQAATIEDCVAAIRARSMK